MNSDEAFANHPIFRHRLILTHAVFRSIFECILASFKPNSAEDCGSQVDDKLVSPTSSSNSAVMIRPKPWNSVQRRIQRPGAFVINAKRRENLCVKSHCLRTVVPSYLFVQCILCTPTAHLPGCVPGTTLDMRLYCLSRLLCPQEQAYELEDRRTLGWIRMVDKPPSPENVNGLACIPAFSRNVFACWCGCDINGAL